MKGILKKLLKHYTNKILTSLCSRLTAKSCYISKSVGRRATRSVLYIINSSYNILGLHGRQPSLVNVYILDSRSPPVIILVLTDDMDKALGAGVQNYFCQQFWQFHRFRVFFSMDIYLALNKKKHYWARFYYRNSRKPFLKCCVYLYLLLIWIVSQYTMYE